VAGLDRRRHRRPGRHHRRLAGRRRLRRHVGRRAVLRRGRPRDRRAGQSERRQRHRQPRSVAARLLHHEPVPRAAVTKQLKPILHARDHGHAGADPVHIVWEDVGISGGGGAATANQPWVYVQRRNVAVASSAGVNTTIDFDTSNANVSGAADASGKFTLNVLSGANHGIRINQAGTYLWSVNATSQTTGAPAASSIAGVISNLDNGDLWSGDYYRPWYALPSGTAKNFDVSLVCCLNPDPSNITTPYTALCPVTHDSGLSLTFLVPCKSTMISTLPRPP